LKEQCSPKLRRRSRVDCTWGARLKRLSHRHLLAPDGGEGGVRVLLPVTGTCGGMAIRLPTVKSAGSCEYRLAGVNLSYVVRCRQDDGAQHRRSDRRFGPRVEEDEAEDDQDAPLPPHVKIPAQRLGSFLARRSGVGEHLPPTYRLFRGWRRRRLRLVSGSRACDRGKKSDPRHRPAVDDEWLARRTMSRSSTD